MCVANRYRVFSAGGLFNAAAAFFLDRVLSAGADGGGGAGGLRFRSFFGAWRKDGGCTGK